MAELLGSELMHKASFASGSLESYRIREQHISKYGFAVLCADAIERLRKYGPFVEVGAGVAYWSYCLNQAGIDSIPTDAHLEGEGRNYGFKESKRWMEVTQMTAKEAVVKYPERSLLTVWPCYDDEWAYEMVKEYKGKTVVYVGEGMYGCTATDSFHQYLDNTNYDGSQANMPIGIWQLVETIAIPQFYGIHDRIYVYQRKESK